jgi:hypothetical protein
MRYMFTTDMPKEVYEEFKKDFWEWFDDLPKEEKEKFWYYSDDASEMYFLNMVWNQRD